jgi:hypothetical protein
MTDEPSADSFDQWYSDMEHAPLKDEIQQRHLGSLRTFYRRAC